MNAKRLLPALLIVQLMIAACMVTDSEPEMSRSGGSMPSARDVDLSFGSDCVAWQANARFSGHAPGPMGAWSAIGTGSRGCMDFR